MSTTRNHREDTTMNANDRLAEALNVHLSLTGDSPQDRRIHAINDLATAFVEFADGVRVADEADAREAMACLIRQHLPALGKTARWHDGVTAWAELVADDSNPIVWAILQGGVKTSWAAV
jgi:hypothetical protein